MLAAAIKDMLVERRRIAVSLDTEIRVEEVRGLVLSFLKGSQRSQLSQAQGSCETRGGDAMHRGGCSARWLAVPPAGSSNSGCCCVSVAWRACILHAHPAPCCCVALVRFLAGHCHHAALDSRQHHRPTCFCAWASREQHHIKQQQQQWHSQSYRHPQGRRTTHCTCGRGHTYTVSLLACSAAGA